MRQDAKKIAELIGDDIAIVIEPTPNYRASIKQFLVNLRVKNIRVVSSTQEARREMLMGRVGVFIVEWRLVQENGLQFCRDLRATPGYRETPFMLMSVENLQNDVILASEVGITGYLLKPFSYEDFCGHLRQVLAHRAKSTAFKSLLDMADQRLSERNFDVARQLYLDASNIKEDSARAITGLAKVAAAKNHHKESLALAHEAIRANPNYVEGYRVLLHIYTVLHDNAGVINTALTLHGLSPDNPKYTMILAKEELARGNLNDSESYFKKTIRLSPKLAEAYKGLGSVYFEKQEYENAIRNFDKALDLDKDDISVLNSIGLTYMKQNKIPEAIVRYKMALKIEPTNVRILFNLGFALEKSGQVSQGVEYYEKILTIDAHFRKAKRRLQQISKGIAPGESETGDGDHEGDGSVPVLTPKSDKAS